MGLGKFLKEREEKRILRQAEQAGVDPAKYKQYMQKRKKEMFIEKQRLQRDLDIEALRTKAKLVKKQTATTLKQRYSGPQKSKLDMVAGALDAFVGVPEPAKKLPAKKAKKQQPAEDIFDDSFIYGGIQ